MVGQERQRELRRTGALVGPLEPGRRQAPQIVARVERPAVDRDHRPLQAAPAAINLHRAGPGVAAALGHLAMAFPSGTRAVTGDENGEMVEPRGIEPLTFALRTRRSPS